MNCSHTGLTSGTSSHGSRASSWKLPARVRDLRRSSAGAYILSERGFQASVLKGGVANTELKRGV